VFEYDSVGQTTTKIPTTGAPWGVSVTPDGTVYYFQNSPTHCGRNVKVVRYPPGGPGVVIGNLPSGSFGLNSYTVTNPDTSVDLFFDQFGCTTGNGDLYKIVGVDTAAPVLERVSSGGALDSPAGPAGPVEPPKPVGWSQGE
jgi:hypothetical protein